MDPQQPQTPQRPDMPRPPQPQPLPAYPTAPQSPYGQPVASPGMQQQPYTDPSVRPPVLPNPVAPGEPGGAGDALPPRRSGAKRGVIVAGIVILLLAIAGGAYYWFSRNEADDSSKKAENAAAAAATPVSSLQNLELVPPKSVDTLKAIDTGTPMVKYYTNAPGNCELQFGVVSAGRLPGSNLSEIVQTQLDALSKSGVPVTPPKPGEALVLKDTDTAGKTYSMPTLTFTFKQGDRHLRSLYSAAVLKNDLRAYVTRVCSSTEGEVSDATIQPYVDISKQIVIKVK